jgi:lipopolysaccharide transport system permease protein
VSALTEATSDPHEAIVIIERRRRGLVPDLRELFRYRELVGFFAWRNILIRYKQTALGIAWAVLQPFFLMVVFSLFFAHFASIPSEGVPYPIFAFAALSPWTFFASSLTQTSNSLIGNANLLSKVFFPRLTLPVSAVISCLVDLALSMVVLGGMMAVYGVTPNLRGLLFLPLVVLLAVITALGAGLLLSALNVAYRDVQYVLPFLTQLWLFASFVVIPSSLVPEPWRTVFGLNPMAGVVETFRWALLDTPQPPLGMIGLSVVVSVVLLGGGLAYFRRMERTFADVI